jgi:16S rRNA (guanine527-N7)-methyltransferase
LTLNDLLTEGAEELGVIISVSQSELFLSYLENLKKWNERINLTAIKEDRGIVINHFIDSLSAAPLIDDKKNLLDIGSGGGFPGIPLKIVLPELDVTLLDSVNKKVSFLNDTIRKLQLKNIRAVWGRAEDENNNIQRKSYGYVLTRAVGSFDEIVSLCSPYLSENGVIILMRGKLGTSEWNQYEKKKPGVVELVDSKEFELPFSDQKRSIFVLKLIGQ